MRIDYNVPFLFFYLRADGRQWCDSGRLAEALLSSSTGRTRRVIGAPSEQLINWLNEWLSTRKFQANADKQCNDELGRLFRLRKRRFSGVPTPIEHRAKCPRNLQNKKPLKENANGGGLRDVLFEAKVKSENQFPIWQPTLKIKPLQKLRR